VVASVEGQLDTAFDPQLFVDVVQVALTVSGAGDALAFQEVLSKARPRKSFSSQLPPGRLSERGAALEDGGSLKTRRDGGLRVQGRRRSAEPDVRRPASLS
jgi:hypothetical protein